MSATVLGVGELAASGTPGEVLKILGLGSCVALIMIDPRRRRAGMAHVALPESAAATMNSRQVVGRFADTAVPALLAAMRQAGADPNPRAYVVKLTGGGNFGGLSDVFNIGKRNALALKKALWEHGLGAVSEDLGGHQSRCVTVEVETGVVRVTTADETNRVL